MVRVNQIETSRDVSNGEDESSIHGPEEARAFREAVEKDWPGARITWAFSWLALKDQRSNYLELKELVVSYHKQYGDEINILPQGEHLWQVGGNRPLESISISEEDKAKGYYTVGTATLDKTEEKQ